jgi:hypothetical protein
MLIDPRIEECRRGQRKKIPSTTLDGYITKSG